MLFGENMKRTLIITSLATVVGTSSVYADNTINSGGIRGLEQDKVTDVIKEIEKVTPAVKITTVKRKIEKIGAIEQAEVEFSNINSEDLEVISSDENVIKVYPELINDLGDNKADILLKSMGVGSAKITVRSKDGTVLVTEDYTVEVTKDTKMEQISWIRPTEQKILQDSTNKLKIDQQLNSILITIPEEATDLRVKYSSSDTEVVTVDEFGYIKVKKPGMAILKVESVAKPSISDEVIVYVGNDEPVESIEILDREISLGIGDSRRLVLDDHYKVRPDTTFNKNVTFSSSNDNIVEIINNSIGDIKAISEGEAEITITSNKDNTKSETIVVKVSNPDIEGTITIEGDTTIEIGETKTLSLSATGDINTTDVKFTSSNEEVLLVNENTGEISGVKEGKATVKVVSTLNSEVSDEVEITVKESTPKDILVQDIEVIRDTITCSIGDTININHDSDYKVVPANATNKNVVITSDNSNVVKIVDNTVGKLEAIGEGNAEITITSEADNTKSGTIVVTVSKPAIEGTLTIEGDTTIKVGQTKALSLVATGDVNVSDVQFTSSNEEILKVDENTGQVKGISRGSAIVKAASTLNPQISDEIEITVVKKSTSSGGGSNTNIPLPIKPEKIVISEENKEITIVQGTMLELGGIISIEPAEAENKELLYKVKDENIVKLEGTQLHGLELGETILEVTSAGNIELKENIKVMVVKKPLNNWTPSELEEQLPYELPTGDVDLGELFNVKEEYFNSPMLRIKPGVNTVNFEYRGTQINCTVQGISRSKKDKEYVDVTSKHWAYEAVNKTTKLGYLNGVDDNHFAPKARLTYQDTMIGLNNVLTIEKKGDVKNTRTAINNKISWLDDKHWAYHGIGSLLRKLDMQYVNTFDKNFNTKPINRGELAKLIMEATKDFDLKKNNVQANYNDISIVPEEIRYVTQTNIMKGDHNGNFNPNETLTRSELATTMYNLSKLL